MTEAPLTYAVLLKGPGAWEPVKVAEAYAAVMKVPFQDASQQLRGHWGIVAESLSEAVAKNLAAKLLSAGLDATILPKNLLEDLPEPLLTCKAEWDDASLHLLPKSGERVTLAWTRLALIATTSYREVIRKTVKGQEGPSIAQKAASLGLSMATGLPINIGGKAREVEKVQETTEPIFFLDLCERKPLRRFRIDFGDFNYACLGSRMGYSSVSNFRALVETIAAKAPSAARNQGTTALLDGKPVHALGYDSLKDLDRECRRLLTLASLRDP
ncbi:MAG: hypothetical protein HY078_08905 [Elusimicrobia bacterium]|nr:hypothetical protein [Elusimicrobiota bacterium]